MKITDTLKARAHALKKELTALYYAYRDPDTPLFSKIMIAIAIGYALSPIDLIPDFIPVLGYLDDVLLLPLLITLALRNIPKEIITKAREKAVNEPVRLKKNWMSGMLFIVIWIAVIGLIITKMMKL